ncbi:hypothetical protein BDN72DRAFT_899596 [Pluteus cervinus]|uniref:Uncharacterized protein n=1 Tax=Pluteus cervinus TaxID=181527 RepID=A0ACD3AM29_9AGAR|nr:hypothetical protein BDN72DRAFT_899596 [Pluteus cervinus]
MATVSLDQDDLVDGSLARGTEKCHRSVAHLALTHEQIASRICLHSQPEHAFYVETRYLTLTILARTCKSLHIPAVQGIWKSMDSLAPLVMTMPIDCWELKDEEDKVREIRLIRSITVNDCDRFRFYAQFVRSYDTRSSRPYTEDPSIFESLFFVMKECGETSILPNLETLDWSEWFYPRFPFFTTFLRPALQNVRILLSHEKARFDAVKDLPVRCPDLRSVGVTTSNDSLTATLSSALSSLENLRDLNISTLSTDAYLRLAEHPNLKSLSVIDLVTVDWEVIERSPPNSLSFAHLENISLDMCKVETAIRTFRSMKRPALRNIKLWIRAGRGAESPLGSLFQSINATQAFDTLSHFDLHNSWSDEGEKLGVLQRSFIPEHLEPLFSFKQLVNVKIELSRPIIMVDSYIQKLAESWPLIEHLVLRCTDKLYWNCPRNTIRSLVHFAINCPYLKELALTFDARDPPELSAKRLNSSISSKLSYMHVRDSPIGNSAMVAAILSDWFPQLSEIDSGILAMNELDEAQREWEMVEAWIPGMRELRSQERRSCGRDYEMLDGQDEAGDV